MADSREQELRTLRGRQEQTRRVLDRIGYVSPGTAPMLVQVFQQTTIPTTTGKYYACHPVDPGGAECEGCIPTFTAEAGTVFVLVVGPRVPVAGDYLIAKPIGGRWVAEKTGGGCPSNILTFTLQRCGTNTCPIVGASVDFVLGGSTVYTGITNASGQVAFTGANPGTYDINWTLASPSLSGSFTGVFVVTGACESLTVIKHMDTPPGAPAYACTACGPEPMPPLFVTDDLGTREFFVDCQPLPGGASVFSQLFFTSVNCAGTGTLVTVSRTIRSGAGCTGTSINDQKTGVSLSCTRPFSASGNYTFSGIAFTVHE